MFTPFGLTPGGGERYFLVTALTFVKLGYEVDILLYEDAKCVSKECIQNTLNSLRIPLSFDDIAIRYISANATLMRPTTNNKTLKRVPMGYYDPKAVNSFPAQGPIYAGKTGQIGREFWTKEDEHDRYDLYMMMGNTKYPQFQAIGKFNIYMCQFPFDLKPSASQTDYKHGLWNTFDKVIVNSKFTWNWYTRVMRTGINRGLNRGLYYSHFPSVNILYPPVEPFKVLSTHRSKTQTQEAAAAAKLVEERTQLLKVTKAKVRYISVFGRFFRGRQSKGHDIAITLFADLLKKVPEVPLHLQLIGFVQPDIASVQYVEDLKKNATTLGIIDKVTFITNAAPDVVGEALLKSTFLWHLTGVQWLKEAKYFNDYEPAAVSHYIVLYGVINRPNVIEYDLDPASLEHFGIAIVEAMFSGNIPIVGSLGGTTDIVTHNYNGMYAETIEDYVTLLEKLLKGPPSEIERLSENAIKSANAFSTEEFMTNIKYEVLYGLNSYKMRMMSRFEMEQVWRMADTVNRVGGGLVKRGESDSPFWFQGGQNPDAISHAVSMRRKHWDHFEEKGLVGGHNAAKKNRRKHRMHRLHQIDMYAHLNNDTTTTATSEDSSNPGVVTYGVAPSDSSSSSANGKKKLKKTAVLFVPGIVAHYELVVNNVLYYLGQGWSLTVLSHRTADYFVRGTLKGLSKVQYIHVNETMQSRFDFDQKLTDPWFWSMFEPDEKVFLFDLDTLVLRKDVDDFLQYDYVSAPVMKCGSSSLQGQLNAKNQASVNVGARKDGQSLWGPGAFSIRTAGVMFDIAARFTKDDIMETEASFFYRHAKEQGYNVASPEVCHSFAWGGENCPSEYTFEVAESEFAMADTKGKASVNVFGVDPALKRDAPLHQRRPFGLHAAWVYMNTSLIERLIDTFAVPKQL
jgi:glycosyltransferase involved in cell wall biosynthesis